MKVILGNPTSNSLSLDVQLSGVDTALRRTLPAGGKVNVGDLATYDELKTNSTINSLLAQNKLVLYTEADSNEDVANEDITVTVDGVSGIDDAVIIGSASKAINHGPFASLQGALNALPPLTHFDKKITINLPAGTHVIDSIDLRKFAGFLEIVGPDLQQVSAVSGTHAVASSSADDLVTLASDPGVADDTLQGDFMRVVSGTGSGQVLPIRTHSGTGFELCGDFSTGLDVTSVVEFVEPAATVDIQNPNQHGAIVGSGWSSFPVRWSFDPEHRVGLFLKHITLMNTVSANVGIFNVGNVALGAEECVIDGSITHINSYLFLSRVTHKAGSGNITSGITRSTYYLSEGIQLYASFSNTLSNGSSIYMFNASLEGFTAGDGIEALSPHTLITFFGVIKGGGNPGFGLDIHGGCYVYCDAAAMDAAAEALSGGTNDIRLDGTQHTWNDLNTASPKALSGDLGSFINGTL